MGWTETKWLSDRLEKRLTALENNVIGGYQLFTSNGEFTVPEGVKVVLVTAIGGGGGGGGSGSVFSSDVDKSSGYYKIRSSTGGGGGAGYFVKDKPRAVVPGDKITVTINSGGQSGAGASATENSNGSKGGNGGTVSFGDLLSVTGGTGGGGGTYAINKSSGDGSVSGTGGTAGDGSIDGVAGSSSKRKEYDPLSDIDGGNGGVVTEVFGGAYGKGGQGGDSTITEVSSTWYAGKNGDAGINGAVLVCWGQFSHDVIY